MSFHYSPKIVTDGLVFAVDAANKKSYLGSGNTWFDLSGNNNNGTLINGPTFDSGNGGSISFDGGDDYVDFGTNSIIKPSGSMTLSYWFKGATSIDAASGVGTMGFSGSRGYLLGPNSGSTVFFYVPGSSTSLTFTTYNVIINNQNWYNISGVYSPSNYIKIYLNGVEVSSNTTSIPASLYVNNISLKVGQRGDGFSFFDGNISQVSLYNKSLSADEIYQNYNALKSRFGL